MKYIKLEAYFRDNYQISQLETKYHIAIKDISKLSETFSPDPVYLFIGTENNLRKYFLSSYGLNEEEFNSIRKDIKNF